MKLISQGKIKDCNIYKNNKTAIYFKDFRFNINEK